MLRVHAISPVQHARHRVSRHRRRIRAERASGEPPRLLESRESLYNNIYVYQRSQYVILTFGHNKQIYAESVFNSGDDRELLLTYTQLMTAGLMYAKNVQSILEIGTGGGRTARYLHRFLPDLRVPSVELDPAVVELSRKYFGLKDEPNFRVEAQDGRLLLSQSKDKYDVIMIDAYRGPLVPFHLLTKEFYQLVRDHLAPMRSGTTTPPSSSRSFRASSSSISNTSRSTTPPRTRPANARRRAWKRSGGPL